jgi:hypothetical protein
MTTSIKKLSGDLARFHAFETIPFQKTSMTVPTILLYSIATKHDDAVEYFKSISAAIKKRILAKGVTEKELHGKLSRKVQEFAWCEVIPCAEFTEDDLTDFEAARVIPYDRTTMTIPNFLFKLVMKRYNGNQKEAIKHIRDRATVLRRQILRETGLTKEELKGKVSHKIQENLWLEFIPEETQLQPIELA